MKSLVTKLFSPMLLILALCACTRTDLRTDTNLLQQNPDGIPHTEFQATGRSAMIASAGEQATRAGLDVFKKGGNAIDAAIAVSFAISVIRPQSTGIGGGGFMLVYSKEHAKTFVFDFRERAPRAAHRDMYVKNGKVVDKLSVDGPLSAAVPGLVAGLIEVHTRFGTLPLKTLIAPAITLARDGFVIYQDLADALEARKEVIEKNQAMKNIFFKEGRPLKTGETLVQTDLAKTLTAIAEKGRAGFYSGRVARAIVEDQKKLGGLITLKDLSQYTVKIRSPVKGSYRGHKIISMPPPSSGGTHVIQMLNILEGYDLTTLGFKTPQTIHVLNEAMRQAYADRAHYLGDPDFVDIPIEQLTSKSYAKKIRSLIHPHHARPSNVTNHGFFKPLESPSTTHMSIVGPKGNVVASTQTINYTFGSCVVTAGTGVILNDEMDDFSALPGVPNAYGLVGGEANAIAPGKTPLSSMSPTIVFKNDKPFLVVGSPGGSKIITGVLQTLLNVIDFKLPLFEAIAHGRIHHQWLPDKLFLEKNALPITTQNHLQTMGHNVTYSDSTFGDIQAIHIQDDGTLIGVSDPRNEGRPMGY